MTGECILHLTFNWVNSNNKNDDNSRRYPSCTYSVPGSALRAFYIAHETISSLQLYEVAFMTMPQITDEKTETQRCIVICPRSHSYEEVEEDSDSALSDLVFTTSFGEKSVHLFFAYIG